MLKITPPSTSDNQPCFRLEGRLVGPWVTELRNTISEVIVKQGGIRLDLAGLHFVDAQGLTLLHTLQEQGAVLHQVTPFVEELLRERQA